MAWNPFSSEMTIEDLKVKDIEREGIKLEVEEQKLGRKIRGLKAEVEKILDLAAESKRDEVLERTAFRRVSEARSLISDSEVRAQEISTQLISLSRLLAFKKHKKELESKGLAADLSKMNLGDLGSELTDMAVKRAEGNARTQEINDILGTDSMQVKFSEPAEFGGIGDEVEERRAAKRRAENV